jgi:hypothetical protein
MKKIIPITTELIFATVGNGAICNQQTWFSAVMNSKLSINFAVFVFPDAPHAPGGGIPLPPISNAHGAFPNEDNRQMNT